MIIKSSERTIDKINVKSNYNILTSQNDLPGSTQPRIIKLHGSVGNDSNYIICEEDYRLYPAQYAPLVNTVQQAMLETQLCLIGFSGDDPNFLNWLGWLRDNMGENCPPIYLVGLFQIMSVSERKTLEIQGITIVDLAELFENSKEFIGHQEALDLFFSKLREYGEEKINIFQPVPHMDLAGRPGFQEKISDTYFEDMDNYLSSTIQGTEGYIAFQHNPITSNFFDHLKEHFNSLLWLEPSLEQINILSKIVLLFRKSYCPLEDWTANRLINILNALIGAKLNDDMFS